MPDLGGLADWIGASLDGVAAMVVGAVLLLFGRRLYWLAAGVIGFVTVFLLTERLAPELSEQALLIASLVAGVVGAALVIFAHRILLGLVGGVGGALIGLWQVQAFGVERGWGWLAAAIVGGLLGAWLLARLFELALIVLSSLLGAQLLVDGMTLPFDWRLPVYAGLTIVGVLVQLARSRRAKRRSRKDD